MLQQTQVSAVVPYFHRFVAALPTLSALAAADEQDVLRLWQGLGYYSRARNLHATAKIVAEQMSGRLPTDPATLRALPGIGRYTAGAIASLAFGVRAPILDGNVIRVLCRLDKIQSDPRSPAINSVLWQRAEEILPKKNVANFNSALMELGATVCTPKSPKCLLCPVRAHCEAFAAGIADRLPLAAKAKPRPLIQRRTLCIHHADKWLIEQRPTTGRWASLWQFITIDATGPCPDHDTAIAHVGRSLQLKLHNPRPLGSVSHDLTHRRYHFDVLTCEADNAKIATSDKSRAWVALEKLDQYPLPRPHLRIADLLAKFAPLHHIS